MKVIVGWYLRRRKKRGAVEYANGAGAWVGEKRRAFIFTTATGASHDDPTHRSGRSWARAHLAVLLRMVSMKGWRYGLVRITRKVEG